MSSMFNIIRQSNNNNNNTYSIWERILHSLNVFTKLKQYNLHIMVLM